MFAINKAARVARLEASLFKQGAPPTRNVTDDDRQTRVSPSL